MNEEFDTINIYPAYGLHGWFDGFCPSNGIADRLNNQAKGVWAQKAEWDKKYEVLKNGKQAAEWESLKKEVRRLEEEIKAEQQKLAQEEGIADALGLGAWCNGAVSRRKKAEESLRNAEKSLGHIKGAFQTLERQQTEGIKGASTVIAENEKKLLAIKKSITVVKQKIARYKAERDHKAQQAAANATAAQASKARKNDLVGKLKENAPLIIGGIALLTAVVYVKKSQSKTAVKSVSM
ncbi:conserved hypothetical protein [Tenacibaculum maritimum]|uniref:hypothetical protein n=1 Tax=Tenacibaculum maritimum TaxID=107401 RepID=UPI0012E688CD|nr:hypothetical protein [Tenacibaculum maritimum]CAA0177273.1 conserved hypothetical protein [Tenacibaculum maritimum]